METVIKGVVRNAPATFLQDLQRHLMTLAEAVTTGELEITYVSLEDDSAVGPNLYMKFKRPADSSQELSRFNLDSMEADKRVEAARALTRASLEEFKKKEP